MKKMLMAVYGDGEYERELTDFFMKKNFLMDCRLFTKEEALQNFMRKKPPDVLLLEQKQYEQVKAVANNAKQVVLLTGEKEEADAEGTSFRIFKYQSVEAILEEILQLTEGSNRRKSTNRQGGVSCITICHPYGAPLLLNRLPKAQVQSEQVENTQMQTTQVQFELAKEEKSLYVDMELFSGIGPAEGKVAGQPGLSELIFYVKQKKEGISEKLEGLVRNWEGVDYLYPVEDYRDLYSLEREDIDRLLQLLTKDTAYERVYFSIGFLSDATLYLFYLSNQVFLPKPKNHIEERQREAFERLLTREGLEQKIDRLQYL